jgi:DNA-binding transcriptional LysR family regulator
MGVALLPEFAVADDLRAGTLVPLFERLRAPAAPIHAIWPARRHATPAARAFLDFLVAELAAG